MSVGQVLLTRRGAVAEMRFSNPAKYNAMSLAMWQEFARLVRSLHDDAGVRVLLLRGEGDKAFISGADISEFDSARSAETGGGVYDEAFEQAQAVLSASPFPVVACIHGICMGGGLGLISACDLRYATADAKFRMPAARLGLGYSFSGVQRLVDVLGAARVADLFYTARTFNGAEAERIGLVQQCFEATALDAKVAEIVEMIATNAPLTVRLAKASIRHALAAPDAASALRLEQEREACLHSADYAEGRRAFAEKRMPVFSGR